MDPFFERDRWQRYNRTLPRLRSCPSTINSHSCAPSGAQSSGIANDLLIRVHPCRETDLSSTPRLHVAGPVQSNRTVLNVYELVGIHPCVAKPLFTEAMLTSVRTILFAPFVPFIVLFCNVIETKDQMDLARLQAFVASLQLESAVSEAADKLRRLFQVLLSVASHYVETQNPNSAGEHQRQASSIDIDTYLSTLGFPSASQVPAEQPQHNSQFSSSTVEGATMPEADNQQFQRGVNPMLWMGNGAQLEDWFYNNQQVMTLLEDEVWEP